MSRPHITFNIEDLKTPEQLERVLRQFETAVLRLPLGEKNPPISLIARQLEPAIRDQIESYVQTVEGDPAFIVDTHNVKVNLTPANSYQQGSAYYETDRDVVFVNEISNAAHIWRYMAGDYRAAITSIPTDLGSPDDGFRFFDSGNGVTHRWDGTNLEWVSRVLGVAAYDDDDNNAPVFQLIRSRGTVLAPTEVSVGATIGDIDWLGQLSETVDDIVVGARIRAVAEDTWTAGSGGAVGDWGTTALGDSGDWGTGYYKVYDSVEIGTDLYIALGSTSSGGGEVWRLRSGTWTQVGGDGLNGSWAANIAFNTVFCLATDGTRLYAGIGDRTDLNAGAEVWQLTPDTSWVKIGDHSLGFPTGTYVIVSALYWNPGNSKLYAGLQAFSGGNGKLIEYQGSTGNWNERASTDTLPDDGGSGYTPNMISAIEASGSTMWIGTGTITGNPGVRIYEATVGTWSWTQIGGDGVGGGPSSVATNSTCTQLAYDSINGELYAIVAPTAGISQQQRVHSRPDASTWSKIGGDGVNSGWNSNVASSALRYDGGIVVDTAYIYANIGTVSNTENGVYRRLLTGGNWEYIAGNTQNNSWDHTDGLNGGRLKIWSGFLYAGIGTNSSNAEIWRSAVQTANQSAHLQFFITQPDDTALTLVAQLYSNLDIGMGGDGTLDGIFYDHSERAVGILTQTPARTFHVAGDDGWRLNTSAQPASPAAGDQIINSNEGNWLEWYDGGEWRFAVSGPASAAKDGNVALFDGISGRIIKDGGTQANFVKNAGAWVPVNNGDPANPRLFFDSNGEVLMAWVPFS